MRRTPSERLSALVSVPLPREGENAKRSDLERILSLPRRPVVICERDPVTGLYPPATQALMEIVTASFTRGARVSCACRPRRITRLSDGAVVISRVLPSQIAQEPPRVVQLRDFLSDNRTNAIESATAVQVASLKVGESIDLPAADGEDSVGYKCIVSLNPAQSWFLHEAPQSGGIAGLLGVGSGKTYAFLLAPLVFPDGGKAALCIEPKQRQHYRKHYLRLREHFRVSTIVFDNDEYFTVPGTVPVHLVSYSVLSLTKNSDLLDRLDPDILMLDECHRACGDSAINRRIKRFCTEKIHRRERDLAEGRPVRARAIRLLAASGTFENKRVQDTQMLCAYSLGTGSPLPLDPDEAVLWSAVMDPSRRNDRESDTARALYSAFGGGLPTAMDAFADQLVTKPEKAVREGFCRRRMETVGVISASASSVNAAIYFSERKLKIPRAVQDALRIVRDEHRRPDGDELVDRMQQVTCARVVGSGFFNYWAFPKHPCSCPPDRVRRCERCLLIDRWFARRKAYKKELRAQLLLGELNLDTEKLCEEAAARFWQEPPYKGKLPKWACETWPAWKEVEDAVEHVERVEWIDDYVARDAAEWAQNNRGIVWFRSTPLGRKISELSGLPYFNGGPGCEQRLSAEKGDRSVILSIKALGSSTDGLQHKFSEQLIVEPPASNGGNEGMEQLLGRLHRDGQAADIVKTYGNFHILEFKDALRQVIVEAEFNYEMTKTKQRILLSDLDLKWL